MGNTTLKGSNNYGSLSPDWVQVERTQTSNTWVNEITGEEMEQYLIQTHDGRDYIRHKQVYNFRYLSETLVASKYFKEISTSEYCTTIYKANLYLEKIYFRLKDLEVIDEKYILHIYKQAFKGFMELVDKIGSFNISEGMICFNQRMQVKVWVNEDLTATESMKPRYGSTLKGESQMVIRIVEVISKKSGDYKYIGTYILNQEPNNLESALAIILNLERVYHGSLPNQEDLMKQFVTRSVNYSRINKKNFSKNLSQSYKQNLNLRSSVNSFSSNMNKSLNKNEYLGRSVDNIHNNINMSIPVSSVKQINQTNITRGGPQTIIGSGRDIHGNPIQLSGTNHFANQQRIIRGNTTTVHNANHSSNIIQASGTQPHLIQRGAVTGSTNISQGLSNRKIITSPVNHFSSGNVQQTSVIGNNVSRLGGTIRSGISQPTVSNIRKQSIINTQRKISPLNTQTASGLTTGLFPPRPSLIEGRFPSLQTTNRSHLAYLTQQHSPAVVSANPGVRVLQNNGIVTQFYKEQIQTQNVDKTDTFQELNQAVIIEDTNVDNIQLDGKLLEALRQQSQALNQHIKSEVDINERHVSHIEGQTVGANGIVFQSNVVTGSIPIINQQIYSGPSVVQSSIPLGQVHQIGVPTVVGTSHSRLHNTMNRISGSKSAIQNVQVINNRGVAPQVVQPQFVQSQNIRQVNEQARIIQQTTPIPATISETKAFDFSKVGDNSQYTSPQIRKLLMKPQVHPNQRPFEPVFVPDQRPSLESPIKKAQIQQPVNNGFANLNVRQTVVQEQTTAFQNNPYFIKSAGLQIPQTPQSNIQQTTQIHQSNLQQQQQQQGVHQIGSQLPRHLPQNHLPQRLPHHLQRQPQQYQQQPQPQQFIHQNQPRVVNPPHVASGIHHHQIPQQHPNLQSQFHQPNIQVVDPRLLQQQLGAIQSVALPGGFGMPFVPPEMLGMMNMMGAMSPDGEVIIEMVDFAPPMMEVVVDEQGNQYVEVDVGGVLPMMMGMGMPMGIPMGVGVVGMPIGIDVPMGMGIGIPPMMMGVSPMVIVQDIDVDMEDLTPEMMMQMMGGAAPTRVVRGPTGRLVEVQVPQQPLIPQSFPASTMYANPYQQIPGHFAPTQIPQQFQQPTHQHFQQPPHQHFQQNVPGFIPGRGPTQIPTQIPHPHQNIPFGGSVYQQQQVHVPQPNPVSQIDREEQLRRQQFARQQAEQQRLYADYEAKVKSLRQKREQLIEEEHRRSREEQEATGYHVEHHTQGPQIRETIHTTLTVDQGYGNIVQTHTTQQIIIDREGAGSYNYEEEKIQITPNHQYNEQLYNQQHQINNQYQYQPTTPIQQIFPAQTVFYQPPNIQRAESSSSQRSQSKLNQKVISQPLTFSSNKLPGIRSNNNITESGYVQTQQTGQEYQYQGSQSNNYQYQGYGGRSQEVSSSINNYQYNSQTQQPQYTFVSQEGHNSGVY